MPVHARSLRYLFAATVTALLAVLSGTLPAQVAMAGPAPAAGLDAAVGTSILQRAHYTPAQASAAGRRTQVGVQRTAGDWAFGAALLAAPPRAGQYPLGWMFLARHGSTGWRVALDGGTEFTGLAAQAPETVLTARERDVFAAAITPMSTADTTNNTGLRLPFATGQSWTLTGGPHGWGGSETPYSSIDLAGGDSRVLAAGGGNAYLMCSSTISGQYGGWVRVYHSSGYTTDYYHLWSPTNYGGGWVGEGAYLGLTGTNTCAGGSASGRHVHWGLLNGTTRVDWNWREAGKWVFMDGSSAYGGYALHGSAIVYPGGTLYNYGALAFNQGIVDTDGGTTLNKRSGPGTGYSVVGSVADGATITISCWRNGTTHTGRWGTTSVWDKLTDGSWVTDAYVYTGTNTIGPQC